MKEQKCKCYFILVKVRIFTFSAAFLFFYDPNVMKIGQFNT